MTSLHQPAAVLAIGAISIGALQASAGGPISWANPAGGDWSEDTNWSGGVEPLNTNPVSIALGGAYTVLVDLNGAAESIDLSNAAVTLGISNARVLDVFGGVGNEGLILVNAQGSTSPSRIDFEADATLGGAGTLRLNGIGARAQISTGLGVTLTQAGSHTIDGFGQINAQMVNNGTIHAGTPGQELLLRASDKVNNGVMGALGGGRLDVLSITLDQTGGGLVSAGAGSVVELNSATVLGGTLMSEPGGSVDVFTATLVGGDHAAGSLNVRNAHTLTVEDSIDNDGTIVINSDGSTSATQLDFSNTGVFSGAGSVVLNGIGARARLRTAGGATMTNTASHRVFGFGQIEADFINQGLVSADVTGRAIVMLAMPKHNSGVMEALGGGILELASIAVTQSGGGEIVADGAGSIVRLTQTDLSGGELRADNGGLIDVLGAELDDVCFTDGLMHLRNARTLGIAGSLVNEGELVVNSEGSTSATQLVFRGDGFLTGAGTVRLNSAGARARIQTEPGVTVVLDEDHIVRGQGQIEAAMTNDGVIVADVDGGAIGLLGQDKTNNTLMRAQGGASLEIASIGVTQGVGAEIVADGATSEVVLTGASIVGGRLRAVNGAVVECFGADVHGVAFEGLMNLHNARTLRVTGSIANEGEIVVNSEASTSATQILFDDTGELAGSGSVVLNSIDARARLQTGLGATMTNTASHTIEGRGRIEASLINEGLVLANVPGQAVFLANNDKVNNAEIRAVDGASLVVNSITITQGPSGVLSVEGAGGSIDLSNATIVGGTLEAGAGASVNCSGVVLNGVTFSGALGVSNATTLGVLGGAVNSGTLVINVQGSTSATSLRFDDASALGGVGVIELNSVGARSRLLAGPGVAQATLGAGQTLRGIGSIDAPLLHLGVLAPGLDSGVGVMGATRPLELADSTTLEIEVDASSADLLDSSSEVTLGGELRVRFIDGFAPAGFWARTIVEGSSISGKFDVVSVPAPAPGLVTKVINTGTAVLVGHTCQGDQNLDGLLNFFDVSVFLGNFGAMDPAADFNGDGQWNFFDVSIFLNNFGQGC